LSKVFVPQFSPAPETSPAFSPPSFRAGGETSPAFEVKWPPLLSRESAQRADQAAREMEEKILKQARERALRIEREAYEKGFAQGEKDGLELGRKRLEAVLDSLGKVLEEVSRIRRSLYQKHEGEMVRLVFALTRKILRQDLPLPEGWVRETLAAAFRQVLDPRKAILRLNPKDYQYLQAHPEVLPFLQGGGEEGEVRVLADPSITRGGCYLQTPLEDIDATLENQLEVLVSCLWREIQSPESSSPDRADP